MNLNYLENIHKETTGKLGVDDEVTNCLSVYETWHTFF